MFEAFLNLGLSWKSNENCLVESQCFKAFRVMQPLLFINMVETKLKTYLLYSHFPIRYVAPRRRHFVHLALHTWWLRRMESCFLGHFHAFRVRRWENTPSLMPHLDLLFIVFAIMNRAAINSSTYTSLIFCQFIFRIGSPKRDWSHSKLCCVFQILLCG